MKNKVVPILKVIIMSLVITNCTSANIGENKKETVFNVTRFSAVENAGNDDGKDADAQDVDNSSIVSAETENNSTIDDVGKCDDGYVCFCGEKIPLNAETVNCSSDPLIADLSPLLDLKNIRELSVSSLKLTSISVLSQLKTLEKVTIYRAPLESLDGLQGLPHLSTLGLYYLSNLIDFSALKNATGLRILWILDCPIRSIEPFRGMSNLEILHIWRGELMDIAPVSEMGNLEELVVTDNRIKNIEPIRDLKKLRVINFAGTEIENINALAVLKNVERLILDRTNVKNLEIIVGLEKIKYLSLAETRVVDLSPIEKSANLEKLDITNTRIGNVLPLAKITKLKGLRMNCTDVSNLAILENNRQLEWISLSYTKVASLSFIRKMKRIKDLQLIDTKVPRKEIEKLEKGRPEISIDANDFEPIAQKEELEKLCSASREGSRDFMSLD